MTDFASSYCAVQVFIQSWPSQDVTQSTPYPPRTSPPFSRYATSTVSSSLVPPSAPTGLSMPRHSVERGVESLHSPSHGHPANAVRVSEARYRTLVQAISQIVWTRSPGGEFVERQAAWEEFTGQAYAEYLGWGWLDAVHEEDRLR